MIPAGILASSKASSAVPLTHTRVKTASGSSSTNPITVTFNEGTALGSGYVLMAVYNIRDSTAPADVSGWSKVGGVGTNRDSYVFYRQANGSVNSISIAPGQTGRQYSIVLFAIPGTLNGSPIGNNFGFPASTSAGVPIPFAPSSTPDGYGISIASGFSAATPYTWTTFDNGFTTLLNNSYGSIGYKEYIKPGSETYTSTYSGTGWAGGIQPTTHAVIIPLVAP